MARIAGNPAAVAAQLAQGDLEAVVAVSPENAAYLSGFLIPTQRDIRERLAVVLWPRQGDPVYIVCNIEEAQARAATAIADVRAYVEFKVSPMEVLAAAIKEKGLGRSRIGIELNFLSGHYLRQLTHLLPHADLAPADHMLAMARAVKTPAEIELLTRANVATEKAILSTFATATPGETEISMAARLSAALMQAGADMTEFVWINAGTNTGLAHKWPNDYACRPGDLVKVDASGLFSDYRSDLARTGVLGAPSQHQRSTWARIIQVQHETIAAVRPGVTAADVFEVHRRALQRVGLPFNLPHAGHSIGLSVHEEPVLQPQDHTVLVPGMVFMVETRVRIPGREGYHVEDMVVVTPGGREKVTNYFRNDELFVI